MKRLIGLCLLCLLAQPLLAAERPLWFGEFWNNIAYYDTNLEKTGFASLLGRFEGKIGANLWHSPLQLYGAYYVAASQSPDYWDNSAFTGVGLRFKPLESYSGSGWYNEWLRDVKIFAETLSSSYLKNQAAADAANLAPTDQRYGLDLWHEWNLDKPDLTTTWGELWANCSYRTTNFGWEDFNSYIFYFQPKIGWHLGNAVESYLKGDLVASGKKGSSYAFLNVADYGAGLRIEPWRQFSQESEWFRKFKMFVEVLSVNYLDAKPLTPVSSDVRIGIDFSYGR